MTIIDVQQNLQMALDEAARNISGNLYLSYEFSTLTNDKKNEVAQKNPELLSSIGSSLIDTSNLKSHFFTEAVKSYIDSSSIVNKTNGISFNNTYVNLSDNILDASIFYKVSVPFLPDNLFSIGLTNRVYLRIFSGKPLDNKLSVQPVYVYFSTYGRVYHTNRYCPYLLNYTDVKLFSEIKGKYQRCSLCVNRTTEELEQNKSIVYITRTGYAFHISLDCPSFTGNIFKTPIDSVKKDSLCSHCMKGK